MTEPAKEIPRLSPSIASTLISRSPLHAFNQHRLGGNVKKEETPAMIRGKILESLIIGGADKLVAIDADDYRKKEAQAQRDEALAQGRVPVLISKMEGYQTAADQILKNVASYGLDFNKGQHQFKADWNHQYMALNGPAEVACRGYLDFFNLEQGLIIDLKTTTNAHPQAVTRKMVEMGSDIQAVAYLEGIETLYPKLAGRAKILYVFAEIESPYAVTVLSLAGSMMELGRNKWDRATKTWGECLATNKWPSYQTGIYRAEAPTWSLNAEAEEAMRVEMDGQDEEN